MRRVLKALVTRVVEKRLPDNLLQALAPVVSKEPLPWDEAALQLGHLRVHVIRVGTLNIFTDCCASHEPREQSGCASCPPFEFGVAGGNGLVACYGERATAVEQQTKMSIRIFGFDPGAGSRRVPIRGTARSRSGAANSR